MSTKVNQYDFEYRPAQDISVNTTINSSPPGPPGTQGNDGRSAYELAVLNGYVGTLEQWLLSLKGAKGDPGSNGTGTPGRSILTSKVFRFWEATDENPTPPKPVGGDYLNPVPSGWHDTIPAIVVGQSLFFSERVFSSDGQPPQQDEWSEPFFGGDTENVDIDYSLVEVDPGNPLDNPENWVEGYLEGAVWMAIRYKVGGVWGPFTITHIKGEKGEKGDPGTDGTPVETRWTVHNNASSPPALVNTDREPVGWSLIPPDPSSVPAGMYIWKIEAKIDPEDDSLIGTWSPPQRVTGVPGATGPRVEFRFRVDGSPDFPPPLVNNVPDPPDWTTTQPAQGALQYTWQTSATKDSNTGALLSLWSAPTRITGTPGSSGEGIPGPFPSYRGVYNPSTTYRGTTLMIDLVFYGGGYYFTRTDAGSFSGVLPTDTSKWNYIGTNYDSIATGLLLAQVAYIENLGARYMQTQSSGARIEINERLIKKDGSGTPITPPVVIDRNNVAVFNDSNVRVVEMDDNSSPTIGTFLLSFSSYVPVEQFQGDNIFRDQSAYNSAYLGGNNANYPIGHNFYTGFPPFFIYYISASNGSSILHYYYFRYASGGLNLPRPWGVEPAVLQQISIGTEHSSLNGLNVTGAFGTGETRIVTSTTPEVLFGSFNKILFNVIGVGTLHMDKIFQAAVGDPRPNLNFLSRNFYGREFTVINKGTGVVNLVINPSAEAGPSNIFLTKDFTDVSSMSVPVGKAYTFKLLSKTNGAQDMDQWRWAVIASTDASEA